MKNKMEAMENNMEGMENKMEGIESKIWGRGREEERVGESHVLKMISRNAVIYSLQTIYLSILKPGIPIYMPV